MATTTANRQKKIGVGGDEENALVPQEGGVLDERPEFLKRGGSAGRENITAEDIILPRLEIVQALSPSLKETAPEYIEGARAGDLVNSVTKEIYKRPVRFVPVLFTKQYNLWKLRNFGGGFLGSYESQGAAFAALADRVPDGALHSQYEVLDTPVFYGLIITDTAEGVCIARISVSMAKTKAKHARRLNTLAGMTNEDMFNRVYLLGTVDEKGPKGEYKNYTIEQRGYPTEAVVIAAEAFYKATKTGAARITVDRTGEDRAEEGTEY
jgi:hypothetical protein